MRRRFTFAIPLIALLAGWALPCMTATAAPVKVVASFSILADLIAQIGGKEVAITTLVGPDGDAHVYEPKPIDARALADADLVIFNGLGFEPWARKLVKASGHKEKIVEASAGIAPRAMEEEDRDHGHKHGKVKDPHAWQSLANGRTYVANIAAALAKAAPDRAGYFNANAAAYDQRLAELDDWVKAELARIPRSERKIITSHDAFGYFARAYGVDMLAPVGISTEAEASPKDIARLVRQMKAQNVRAVFVENMSDPRMVTQIARDADGVVGGTLYADALSSANGPAPTYEAMFRHNVGMLLAAWKRH